MNHIWVIARDSLPEPPPAIPIQQVASVEEFLQTIAPQEQIMLLADYADLAVANLRLGAQILAYRPLPAVCSTEQFSYLLDAVQADARLQHDLSAAEVVAASGMRGPMLTDDSLEELGRAVIAIAACQTMEAVEELLNRCANEFAPCERVIVQIDPPHLPASELSKYQLAVPVLLAGELLAHVYLRFSSQPSEQALNKVCELLLGLGDAIALAVERNAMLAKAENTKAIWEASFDAVADPVLILSADRKIIRANRAYASLTHTPLEAISGRDFSLFPLPLQDSTTQPALEFEQKYEGKFYRIYLDPILANSFAAQYVLRLRDVSAERALMERIIAREQVAEMGVLAASVAHEINNPIGGISAYAQILLKDLPADSPWRQEILEIQIAADRCKKIVQTLLALVRKADEARSLTPIAPAISAAAELLDTETKRLHVQFSFKNSANSLSISANPNRLTQALFHLLQHSLHAIEVRKQQEKFSAQLSLQLQVAGTQAELIIRDNGSRAVHSLEQESGVASAVAQLILEEYKAKLSWQIIPDSQNPSQTWNEQKIIFSQLLDTVS